MIFQYISDYIQIYLNDYVTFPYSYKRINTYNIIFIINQKMWKYKFWANFVVIDKYILILNFDCQLQCERFQV